MSVTALLTVDQFCQPPVEASVTVPLTFAPSISTCSVPPVESEATRASSVYEPLVATFTVYSSHSPAAVQPTS